MSISNNRDDLERSKFKESTSVSGQPAVVVINPDGSNVGGGTGAVTIADGADVAEGAKADAAYSGSGSASVVSILKGLYAKLAGTLTVSGTVTANAGTNLNTSALALETGGNLATLAGGVSSGKFQDNLSQVGGSAITLGQKVAASSVPVVIASDQGSVAITTGTPTETAVTVTGSSTSVLAANASRKYLQLVNDSSDTIYVSFSGTAALSTGTRLNANGGSIIFDMYVPAAIVKAISSGTSSKLLVTEG